jgi:type IV secretory pathway TraG/TraD family ATPase VirD4
MCGEREVARRTKSVNWSPLYNYENPSKLDLQNLHVTNNNATERMPLIRPHELRNDLGPDGHVTFIADVPKPILAKRLPYFEIPGLKRLAGANPYVIRKPNSKRLPVKSNDNWKRFLAR